MASLRAVSACFCASSERRSAGNENTFTRLNRTENPAELQTLGMDEQHLPQRHDRIHAQRDKSNFVWLHQIIGDRKLDRREPIESDRHGPAFTAEHLGEFLLCLNQLSEALLGHAVACRSTGRHVRPDLLQARSHVQSLSRFRWGREKVVPREGTLPLHPNLPGDPFAAPEIGTIAILQLNSQFAGVGILPPQLTLHEHQRLFELLHGDRLASLTWRCKQSLEILFENSNRGHVKPRTPLWWSE